MLNPRMFTATILTTAVFAASVATIAAVSAASSYVAPVKAIMKISKISCPGSAKLKIIVWSKNAGKVKITLKQEGERDLGSDTITTTKRRNGLYKGVQNGTVTLARTGSRTRYRVIATNGRTSTKSRWVSIRSCALVT